MAIFGKFGKSSMNKRQFSEQISRPEDNEEENKICQQCGHYSKMSYRFCPYCGKAFAYFKNDSDDDITEEGSTEDDRSKLFKKRGRYRNPNQVLYGCPSAFELMDHVPEKTIEVVDYES